MTHYGKRYTTYLLLIYVQSAKVYQASGYLFVSKGLGVVPITESSLLHKNNLSFPIRAGYEVTKRRFHIKST